MVHGNNCVRSCCITTSDIFCEIGGLSEYPCRRGSDANDLLVAMINCREAEEVDSAKKR